MYVLKKAGMMALAFAMVMSLTACGDKVTVSADNINNIEDTPLAKKYVIATNTSFPPFEYKNFLGDHLGIDVDLLNAIATDQGFSYEFVQMPFNEILQAVAEAQVDGAMAGIYITDERKEKFDYSEPYLGSQIALAVNAAREDINSYEDLSGKRVAVTRGTVAEKYAESIKDKYGFTIVSFDEYPETYKDVLKGNSQAIFEDNIVIGFLISQGLELKLISETGQRNFYGFAVPKGKNPELLDMFNKGLEEVKKSGEYQKILDTYIQ